MIVQSYQIASVETEPIYGSTNESESAPFFLGFSYSCFTDKTVQSLSSRRSDSRAQSALLHEAVFFMSVISASYLDLSGLSDL